MATTQREIPAAILDALRQEPTLAHVQVAVLTTLASPEEAAVHELGVSLYRRKPLELDEVFVLGRELMGLCRQHGAKAATTE